MNFYKENKNNPNNAFTLLRSFVGVITSGRTVSEIQ
jgi:hypothetical protein